MITKCNKLAFIGSGSLLQYCAELSQSNGYEIITIYSNEPEIFSWGLERNIPVLAVNEIKKLAEFEIDILFSINNPYILRENIIKNVKFCINYHDSLLPAYAGIGATCWAIMNNEKLHGITWHFITDGVDKGDILIQKEIILNESITAKELNLLCFEAGKETYNILLNKINNFSITPIKQDIRKRTYYSPTQHPHDNLGFIDFNETSKNIDALLRATIPDNYENRVFSPKLLIDNQIVIPITYCISAHKKLKQETAINPNNIIIDSLDGQIIFKSLMDLNRNNVILDNKKQNKINKFTLDKEIISKIKLMMHNETYWVNKFKKSDDYQNGYINNFDKKKNVIKKLHNLSVVANKFLEENTGVTYEAIVISLVMTSLFRLSNDFEKMVFITKPEIQSLSKKTYGLISGLLPIKIKFDMSIYNLIFVVDKQLKEIDNKGFFLYDIFIRYPSLKNITLPFNHPIIFHFTDIKNSDKDNCCPGAHIFINEEEKSCHVLYIKENDEVISVLPSFTILYEGIETVAVNLLKDKNTNLHKIDYLAPERKNLEITEWVRGNERALPERCLHHFFNDFVERAPNNICIYSATKSLSYKIISEMSNKVSAFLHKISKDRGCPIGVIAEKNEFLIAAVIGILKSGNYYLPLDKKQPTSRIKQIVTIADCSIILSDDTADLVDLKLNTGLSIFSLNTILNDLNIKFETESNIESNPRSCAYMLFTSGSTGTPKGIKISHKNVINLLTEFNHTSFIGNGDRGVVWTNMGFDVSIYEIFSILCSGASLFVDEKINKLSGYDYFNLLKENKITTLYLPPFMLSEFNDWLDHNEICLKRLLVGVEPIKYNLLLSIQKKLAQVSIYNGYGPTETTICSTLFLVKPTSNIYTTVTPIGRPINNSSIYILNDNKELLPYGTMGEIHIAGEGLALEGAQNIIQITCPITTNTIEVYATGDYGYWLPDGNIVFCKRKDKQIKHSGIRINLVEIERAMLSCPDVKQCVVVNDTSNNRSLLIAYYILNQSNDEKEVEISPKTYWRTKLHDKLAEFMHPHYFVRLKSFPLTVNNKIDFKRLPNIYNLSNLLSTLDQSYNSEVAEKMRVLWCKHLKIDEIFHQDNFFGLGGNSLIASLMVEEINQHYMSDIKITDIYNFSEFIEFVKYVDKNHTRKALPLIPIEADKPIPLSLEQKALWEVCLNQAALPVYNIPFCIELTGEILVEAVKNSLYEIINTHKILKTNFKLNNNIPYQKISSNKFKIYEMDCSQPETDKKYILKNIIDEALNVKFNIFDDILINIYLIKISQKKYFILFIVHHLICDLKTLELIVMDFKRLYLNMCLRQQYKYPTETVCYADYAHCQNPIPEKFFQYWDKRLDNLPSIAFPQLKTSLETSDLYSGNEFKLEIPKKIIKSLERLSARNNSTLFTTLFTFFGFLISRHTHINDLLLLTVLDTRFQSDQLRTMFGLFMNILPIRLNFEANWSISETIQNNTKNIFNDIQHAISFIEMMNNENLKSKINSKNFVSFGFIYNEFSDDLFSPVGNMALSYYPVDYTTSKLNLSFEITKIRDNHVLRVEYKDKCFKKEFISRLAKNYIHILEEISTEKQITISALNFLSHEERNYINKISIGTSNNYPSEKNIYDVFVKTAQNYPNNIAIKHNQSVLNYMELNNMVLQIAQLLKLNGVVSGDKIILYMNAGIDIIAMMLAINLLKATFIPIADFFPLKRIEYIIQESSPKLIITDNALWGNLRKLNASYHSLFFAFDSTLIKNISTSMENSAVDADYYKTPVYIMYTSGSTGNPKGVIVHNKGILRLVINTDYIKIQPTDVISQTCSVSFDVSVFEIWGALLNGACCAIFDKNNMLTPYTFEKMLNEYEVTIASMTTASFHNIVSYNTSAFDNVEKIVVCGDVLNKSLVNKLLGNRHRKPYFIINSYGPTENSTYSTAYTIHNILPDNDVSVSIGKPIANTSVYILDKNLKMLPMGCIGEIYLAGDGLASGYLNKPELTKEKFIVNEAETCLPKILYRTGDLGCWREDGNLEFLGRIDHQIKIRGYRVECGEIEAELLKFDNIKEARVIPKHTEDGIELVACYVSANHIRQQDIIDHLNRSLPSYMVPKYFIQLDSLPQNLNGKIDLQELEKVIACYQPNVNSTSEIYPTLLATELANIWKNILSINNPGYRTSFFELGGHSLLVSKLLVLIKDKYNITITFSQFLKNPTIENIEDIINSAQINFVAQSANDTNLSREIEINTIKFLEINSSCIPKRLSNVLLTGATGFVGIFLLKSLLECTNYNIYCLVNRRNITQALEELSIKLTQIKCLVKKNIFLKRIIPIVGDLSKEKLGIDNKIYTALTTKIDGIFHNGAIVNALQNYEEMKAVNVHATRAVCDFAAMGRPKQIHHISTLSIFNCPSYSSTIIDETTPIKISNSLADGYSTSKLVAEAILMAARNKGYYIKIYRLGRIFSDMHWLFVNRNDLLFQFIQAIYNSNYLVDQEIKINILPADFVANAIVNLSLLRDTSLDNFHLLNTQFISLTEIMDYAPNVLDKKQIITDKKNLLDYMYEKIQFKNKIDNVKSMQALKMNNIAMPILDNLYWKNYFAHIANAT